MQLRRKRAGHVRHGLAALSASLFAATIGASDRAAAQDQAAAGPTGTSQLDAAILVYQEEDGRVRAIEPSVNATLTTDEGGVFSAGLVSDTLTGASPNGGVASNLLQTFVTPLKGATAAPTTTVTGASGGSTVITFPSGVVGRQYTADPNTLPVDRGFKDQREGGNLGWSQPLFGLAKVGAGAAYSTEQDYRAISGSVIVAQDFNTKNTTVSLAANYEDDSVYPYGGVPAPLTPMNPEWKGPKTSKHQTDIVLGLTQLMSRSWLIQANYSYGVAEGYLNDPYRIIAQVDPVSGQPIGYSYDLYEKRPRSRARHSLYLENKVYLDFNVADLAVRYYTDDWGIDAVSVDLSDRVTLLRWLYVEPGIRWYRQSAADFYRPFLINGQTLPAYASSDTRLAKFDALTFSVKLGVNITPASEIYLRGQYYTQFGEDHPPEAFGQLTQQDLFAEVRALTVMTGYSWTFD